MKKIKKYSLKFLPYIICIIASYAFFILGKKFDSNIKSLLHGISGTFLSIPTLYLIYELSKNFSQHKLNKELFDYAKIQIDRDMLATINQLMKLVLPYEMVSISQGNITDFLSQTKDDITTKVKTNNYLGFQVFKNWFITERNITKILENPFILQHLDNEQVIAIVGLLKEIRSFEFVAKKINDLYISTGENAKGYKIESGMNLSERNNEYPDRYLLLKNLGENKYRVKDFGDFAIYQKEKLLQIYKINNIHLDYFATSILYLIKRIKLWVELTGDELLIDVKIFRPSLNKKVEKGTVLF